MEVAGQRPLDPLELELPVILSLLTWDLGTKPVTSAEAVVFLTEPSLQLFCYTTSTVFFCHISKSFSCLLPSTCVTYFGSHIYRYFPPLSAPTHTLYF